jgi:hypothetical protein
LIPLNTPVVLDFPGDGTEQIEFPISFPTFEESNIEAEIVTPSGALISLVKETHYLLDNIGIPNTDATFILQVSPSFEWTESYGLKQDYELKIRFSTNAFQPAKLRDLGRFAPEVFEKALDRLTMNTLSLRQIALETPEKLEELQNQVGALAESVDAQQDEIDGLSDRLNTAEQNISSISDENISQQTAIDSLSGRLDTAETTLSDHELRIAAIESEGAITSEVELKTGDFAAVFGKVYVVRDAVFSVLGDNTQGTFEISFPFADPDAPSVRVVSPTSEVTVLTRNTAGQFDPINGEYEIDGQLITLLGGPYPWIGDGGFGGLEVGWTLIAELQSTQVALPIAEQNKSLSIKKLGTNLVTLVRNGSEKIDDVSSNKNLTSIKESVTLISDGVDWFII